MKDGSPLDRLLKPLGGVQKLSALEFIEPLGVFEVTGITGNHLEAKDGPLRGNQLRSGQPRRGLIIDLSTPPLLSSLPLFGGKGGGSNSEAVAGLE